MSGPDVFISYSREDRAAAQHFAECFAQEGFSVWWDAALHSGETFDEVIEAELKAAKAVVVLWSPRSVTSRWVRAEATLADRRNKLAPVIIEPCDRPIIFELTHTADLTAWTGEITDSNWRVFVRDLRRLVDRDAEGAKATPAAAGARFADRLSAAQAARPSPPVATPEPADEPKFAPVSQRRQARPQPEVDSQATQFYTRDDGVDMFGDEFHCLEIVIDGRLEKRFVVSPLGVKIGRTPPADIVLADARVSRNHCMVELADSRLRVSDLGSTNGTYIDGNRIDGFAMLDVGSILRVGNVSFTHAVRTRADV